MANGRLGAVDLAATTNTAVYTAPASTVATVNINVCNRNTTDVAVRVMHLDGAIGTLAAEDYIEYDLVVPAKTAVERTGVAVAAGHVIAAYSDTANVSVQVNGFEESA